MLFIFADRKALGDGAGATKKRLKNKTYMKQYQNYLFGAMCVTALAL